MIVQRIMEWKKKGEIQVSHVLREGNQLINYLTNKFIDFIGTIHFHNGGDLQEEHSIKIKVR